SAYNPRAYTDFGQPVWIEKLSAVEKLFMLRFAKPNIAGRIVRVDGGEDNSLMTLIDAPDPFNSVPDAMLGLRGSTLTFSPFHLRTHCSPIRSNSSGRSSGGRSRLSAQFASCSKKSGLTSSPLVLRNRSIRRYITPIAHAIVDNLA